MSCLVSPHDSDRGSSCGYCSPSGTRSVENTSFHSASMSTYRLSCEAYQEMIDRGWRRSGTYCYKPNMKLSCCPQYTIKLDALEFKPSKSQRKLVNRWNRFVLEGEADEDDPMDADGKRPQKPSKGKPLKSKSAPFSLISALHASERAFITDAPEQHPGSKDFSVTLEPSTFTAEKFALYEKYQATIHNDPDKDPDGFKSFLVTSPLTRAPIQYSSPAASNHLPTHYGSYHQMYRLDGRLIAIGVLDILPHCVSSVYFMYDPDFDKFSLGKLSALREVSLAREMHDAGAPDMRYLYMGFYIYSCQKMRYKGEYAPSYLADPETYEWYPLQKCLPLLADNRYACFADPEHSSNEPAVPNPPRRPEPQLPPDVLREVLVAADISPQRITVVPLEDSEEWGDARVRRGIAFAVEALGGALAKKMVLVL
ncbi:hypothetical protein PLICRDRAFT_34070 [Plicaturopsis crispa FD-325 SS-3]|nr:hypothetical protein PLICRDRAFT_34070 [Plicaturopsis crispa FD-325 SS-3]